MIRKHKKKKTNRDATGGPLRTRDAEQLTPNRHLAASPDLTRSSLFMTSTFLVTSYIRTTYGQKKYVQLIINYSRLMAKEVRSINYQL